jgi:hypothetical protein
MVQRLIKIKLPCKALQTTAALLATCQLLRCAAQMRNGIISKQRQAYIHACSSVLGKMTNVAQVLADLTQHCHWRHQYRCSKHRLHNQLQQSNRQTAEGKACVSITYRKHDDGH